MRIVIDTNLWVSALISRLMRNRLEIILPTSNVKVCRDPKDDYLFAIAKDGAAAFLLSGDKDLFEIVEFENTKIVSLSEFERSLV